MINEFHRILRVEFEKRLREKRYIVDTIMMEFDMAASSTLVQMKDRREKEAREKDVKLD
jgi:hypothetical protein